MTGHDAELEELRAGVSCAALLERLPPPWRLDKQQSTRRCLKYHRAEGEVLLVTHDVEEALFLANRVIVFSERPARITAEVRNDAPYPRHRDDPKLVELRREVLALLGLVA